MFGVADSHIRRFWTSAGRRSERRTSHQERLTFTTACGPTAEREGATAGGVEESPLGQELFGHVQNAESHAFGDRPVMRIPREHVE